MKRIISVLAVSVALLAHVGCSSTGGAEQILTALASEPAVASLTQSLGVTANQAIGGIGALLSLAKGKFSPEQFASLASAIPSSDKFMSALSGLGIKGSDIKDAAGLNAAYRQLGMSADTASRFTPAVADLAGKTGGDTVKAMLAGLGM